MNLHELLGYPLFLVSAFELVLGVILLRQNPRNSPVNKSIAAFAIISCLFAFNTAVMYLLAARGLDYNLSARLNWIGWLSVPAALQFVFFLKDEKSRVARMVGLTLYPFWLVMLALSVFTNLIVTNDYILIPFFNRPGPLENAARLIGGLLVLWLVFEIIRLREEVSGIKKAQLNYFFHGTLICAAAAAITAGFLQVIGGFGFEPGLASYFSFPWAVLTFYAISQYRLFDIRIIFSRTLSAVFLAILFSTVHILLFKLLEPTLGATGAIFISLFVMATVFFGTSVNAVVHERIQRLVLQDKYAYQDIIRQAISSIITKLDFDELLKCLIDAVKKSLWARNVRLFLRTENGAFELRRGFEGEPTGARDRVLREDVARLMAQTKRTVVREELERKLPEREFGALNERLKADGAEVVIPLFYQDKLQGVMTLGHKGSGEAYIQSDIDLLETLAGYAAIAIENARLYEEARRVKESLKESEARFSSLVEQTIRKYLSH